MCDERKFSIALFSKLVFFLNNAKNAVSDVWAISIILTALWFPMFLEEGLLEVSDDDDILYKNPLKNIHWLATTRIISDKINRKRQFSLRNFLNNRRREFLVKIKTWFITDLSKEFQPDYAFFRWMAESQSGRVVFTAINFLFRNFAWINLLLKI